MKEPRGTVVCAACKYGMIIVCGARHFDTIMRGQLEAMGMHKASVCTKMEQGFINQYGEFLTRTEALALVKKNGQPFDLNRNGCSKELYSEGLY